MTTRADVSSCATHAALAEPEPEPGFYEFRAAGRAATRRLEALVRPTDELDLGALAARVVAGFSARAGATPWKGISARPRRVDSVFGSAVQLPRTETEAVASLRDELRAAVRRELHGATRVAVMTGGGVDSSALLALAVEWAVQDPRRSAFAVALDFWAHGDDRPYLRSLEDHLGCEVIRVQPEDAAARIALVRRGVDAAPLIWPTSPMEIEALARAKANGADRALMGVNGDHLLDGSARSLSAMARRGELLNAVRAARGLVGFDAPRSRSFSWLLRPMIAACEPSAIRRRRLRRSLGVPAWAGPRLLGLVDGTRDRFVTHAMMPRATGDDRVRADQADPAREHVEWVRHHLEVASGLCVRDPYRDAALTRTVLSLPPEWLLHGGIRRGLFREAMRGLLPESIRTRLSKASFEPGIARFVQSAGGLESVRDLARVPRLADLGLVEPRSFLRAFEELVADPVESFEWCNVWPVLAVEAFVGSRG